MTKLDEAAIVAAHRRYYDEREKGGIMNQKEHRAVEAAVTRCEALTARRPDFRWSGEYRRYYEATMADIGRIRYRPGLVTQLRRRMRKVRPIEPPPAGVAIGATEADGVQS